MCAQREGLACATKEEGGRSWLRGVDPFDCTFFGTPCSNYLALELELACRCWKERDRKRWTFRVFQASSWEEGTLSGQKDCEKGGRGRATSTAIESLRLT